MPSPVPPVARPNRALLLYALASAGGVIGYLPLLTLLLPVKVELLAGEARIGVLTATVLAGAIAASLSNVLFGWLSDRSVERSGGRRSWLAGGLVSTAVSFAVIAATTTPLGIVLGIVLFQIAINAVLAPLLAMMAEEIPDARKGVAGGLLALGQPLAAGVSALLVGLTVIGDPARLALIWVALAACIAPVLLVRFAPVTPVPLAPTGDSLARRDLLVAWGARLLMQVAGNVLSIYLIYYFGSIAPGTGSIGIAPQIGALMTIAFVLPLPLAVLLGRLSDRTGRRKPFLLGAAAVAAVGLVGMALANSWSMGAVAFCIYATGSAVFLALHGGFAMQLLPNPHHRGRDLGLLNLANTLPALIGPPLTWLLATPRDFDALMLALAALTLCGGLMILLIGGRR